MSDVDRLVERAEQEMLELIRLHDSQNFTLTITCDNGQWSVSTDAPDDMAGASLGSGVTFAEAWFKQIPVWAHKE